MKETLFKIFSKIGFKLYIDHLDYNCKFWNVGKDSLGNIVFIYQGRREDIICYGYNPRFRDLR